MTKQQLKKILNDHKKWWNNNGGQGADLQGVYLQGAYLQVAYLQGADLQGADLQGADLQGADLQGADLQGADLRGADLRGADLQGADLQGADLRGADLRGADLQGADLQGADLRGADLQGADLQGAKLTFQFKRKLVSSKFLMDKMFKKNRNKWVVYKSFGENYNPPKKWNIQKGKKIKQQIDPERFNDCSFGINVATLEWCKNNCSNQIWELHIPKEAEVCVPIYTDGKVRVSEAVIVKKIEL